VTGDCMVNFASNGQPKRLGQLSQPCIRLKIYGEQGVSLSVIEHCNYCYHSTQPVQWRRFVAFTERLSETRALHERPRSFREMQSSYQLRYV